MCASSETELISSRAMTPRRKSLWTTIREARPARRGAISFVLVFVVWELVARYLTSEIFLAAPSKVVSAFFRLLSTGELQKHVTTSGMEFGLGFGLAAIIGISLGLVLATNNTAREYVDPLLAAMYAVPMLAITPLFILWLGIDISSKVAVIFLASVFSILINTMWGIRSADQNHIEVARSFGASTFQIFIKTLLPSAVPFIVAGLRLGVGRGIVAIVVAEFFGSRAGLGRLILQSAETFASDELFLAVAILALAGMASVTIIERVERRISPWRQIALRT